MLLQIGFLLFASRTPFEPKVLEATNVYSVYRVDSSHVATLAGMGDVQAYDASGDAVGPVAKVGSQDLLGFESWSSAVVGREYSDGFESVSLWKGTRQNFEGSPNWRTLFDRRTFILTDGEVMVLSNAHTLASLDNVGWHDMYCLSLDAKSLFLIHGDFVQGRLEKVDGVDTLAKLHHARSKILRTTSGKNLHVILPSTSSLIPLTRDSLVCFCLLDGFSKAEQDSVPITIVGKPDPLATKAQQGICEIDWRTGVGHLVARLIDTTNYGEGPDFNSPMENRRDLAAVESNGSFLAHYGPSGIFFKRTGRSDK